MKRNMREGLHGNIQITKYAPKAEAMEISGLVGIFDLKLYGPDGILKDLRHVKNFTTDGGFAAVCDLMGKGTPGIAGFQWCAIGTGTADTSSSTMLAIENARVNAGYTRTSNTVWKNEATFGAGVGTGAITESGLMNNASIATGNTMLCAQTFAVINKGNSDTLVVTWQYTLS